MSASRYISLINKEAVPKQDRKISIELSINTMKNVVAQGLWNFDNITVISPLNGAFKNQNITKL